MSSCHVVPNHELTLFMSPARTVRLSTRGVVISIEAHDPSKQSETATSAGTVRCAMSVFGSMSDHTTIERRFTQANDARHSNEILNPISRYGTASGEGADGFKKLKVRSRGAVLPQRC